MSTNSFYRTSQVKDAMTKGNSKQRSCIGRQDRSVSRPPTQQSQPANQQVCTRCGKGVHSRSTCPAREAVCHKCNKKGHYSAVSHTKTAAAVSGNPWKQHTLTLLRETQVPINLGSVTSKLMT